MDVVRTQPRSLLTTSRHQCPLLCSIYVHGICCVPTGVAGFTWAHGSKTTKRPKCPVCGSCESCCQLPANGAPRTCTAVYSGTLLDLDRKRRSDYGKPRGSRAAVEAQTQAGAGGGGSAGADFDFGAVPAAEAVSPVCAHHGAQCPAKHSPVAGTTVCKRCCPICSGTPRREDAEETRREQPLRKSRPEEMVDEVPCPTCGFDQP
jgi:hypothetical protein